MHIRAFLADGDPLHRQRLRDQLATYPDLDVVGEEMDGQRALYSIRSLAPDLLFLDVPLPGLDGFDLLTALEEDGCRPAPIFVTSSERYALRAFEFHAVDYLVKPFASERLDRALRLARDRLRPAEPADSPFGRVEEYPTNGHNGDPRPREWLLVKSAERVVLLRTADIDRVEAAGNYVRLHVGKETHLLRGSMARMEARLDRARFLRIHRSAIVRIDHIRELQPWFHGDYRVLLRDGKCLTMSRNYRQRLEAHLAGTCASAGV